jgi:hypothetical protein
MSQCRTPVLAASFLIAISAVGAHGSPWASSIISYTPGAGVDPGYTNPSAALGEPTRFTGVGIFPGAVTPFNPAWMPGELVSIGPGGSLTVQLGRPVVNDPLNPFGIDFLIFGNAGYIDTSFPNGIAGSMFSTGIGTVEVSADGQNWELLPGVTVNAAFPTLGFSDTSNPYSTSPGLVPTDFTRPVDPALNATGLSFSQLVAAYAGSGGGIGIDIAPSGLAEISFVRISNPASASGAVSIDAFSIVTPIPAPGALALLGAALPLMARRKRSV